MKIPSQVDLRKSQICLIRVLMTFDKKAAVWHGFGVSGTEGCRDFHSVYFSEIETRSKPNHAGHDRVFEYTVHTGSGFVRQAGCVVIGDVILS
jgi:hypothetical protein